MIKPQDDYDQTSLTINAHVVESTGDISLLGVNIDEDLVFSKHITELCKKANKRMGVLSRLRNLIPKEVKSLVYQSSISAYSQFAHTHNALRLRVTKENKRVSTCSKQCVFKASKNV